MIGPITYATCLTLLRCGLVPFIIYSILQGVWLLVIVLMVAAGLTDFFDGFVARHFSQETTFGALLDPVADKALLLGSYGALWYGYEQQLSIPGFFCVIAFLRESCILIGACLLLRYRYAGIGKSLMPTTWGKRATAMHIILLLLLCAHMLVNSKLLTIVVGAIMVLVLMSMGISFVQYVHRGLEE